MGNEIQLNSDSGNLSFMPTSKGIKFTLGQLKLLELCNQKLQNKEPIGCFCVSAYVIFKNLFL